MAVGDAQVAAARRRGRFAVEHAFAGSAHATPDAVLAKAVARLSDLYTTDRARLSREQADAAHLAAKREYFLASDAPKVALALDECTLRSQAFVRLSSLACVRVADLGCATFADVPVTEEEQKAWGPFADPRLLVLPRSVDAIDTFYRGDHRIPMLQRMLSLRVEGLQLDAFLASGECSAADRIRLASCRSKHACKWIFAHPLGKPLTDEQFSVAMRLRLGLPPLPFALPAVCPLCRKAADPWHALACSAVRRRAVTTRHDRGMQLLVRFARSNGVLARPRTWARASPTASLSSLGK